MLPVIIDPIIALSMSVELTELVEPRPVYLVQWKFL